MGNLLGAPKTEKETHQGETPEGLQYGVSTMQGWRVHMEDAHLAEVHVYAVDGDEKIHLAGHSIFGVFDGHGGTLSAVYSGKNLCRVLSKQPKFVEYAKFEKGRLEKEKCLTTVADKTSLRLSGMSLLEDALCHAFIDIDKEIALALKGQRVPGADTPYNQEEAHSTEDEVVDNSIREGESEADAMKILNEEGDSGTTACVVVITPEYVLCANAGDSRSVMSKDKRAIELSFDHKPDDEGEEKRIRAAGGYVAGGRVEGDLAVSRGLGDFRFKNIDVVMEAAKDESEASAIAKVDPQSPKMPGDQKVSPKPDMVVQKRTQGSDDFIIIACDGIWDVQTNAEGVNEVAEMFEEGESDLGLVCEELCDVCLSKGSKDNMTALVVKLEAQVIGEGGGIAARREKRDLEKLTNSSDDGPLEITASP